MGTLSFALPFVSVWMFTQYVLGWEMQQAQIAGIALSTTSVAVVYSVMIERGLSETNLGKLILAACFITDLGTVLALGVLFAEFNVWMLLFVVATVAAFFLTPFLLKVFIGKLGANKVREPEIKFVFLILLLLAGLAAIAGSEGVLPAYIMGLALAGIFINNKTLVGRIRSTAFIFFTPFYFIKAGLYISLKAMIISIGVIAVLLLIKVISKTIGVWPVSRAIKLNVKMSNYTTLLMSTGLTFGSISALYGLNNGIINQNQYTILVTVVILSAVIPTLIAQKFFEPSANEMNGWKKKSES
jgi:Kef-type K+ transport system membrane component KefB